MTAPFSLVMPQVKTSDGARATRPRPGRVCGLAPALAHLAALAQQPVHGGDRAQVEALVQQRGPHLRRRLEIRRLLAALNLTTTHTITDISALVRLAPPPSGNSPPLALPAQIPTMIAMCHWGSNRGCSCILNAAAESCQCLGIRDIADVYQMADYCDDDPFGPAPDLPEEGIRSLRKTPAPARLDRGGGLYRRRLAAGIVQHSDGVLVTAAVQIQRQFVDRPKYVHRQVVAPVPICGRDRRNGRSAGPGRRCRRCPTIRVRNGIRGRPCGGVLVLVQDSLQEALQLLLGHGLGRFLALRESAEFEDRLCVGILYLPRRKPVEGGAGAVNLTLDAAQ
ncbi:hypothetical protein AB0B45_15560 [Nonomuraea sp. NPDC049152]|uniref:hypothetical protein n=1 Tax=Nonomuraea sp. NPDC049152 TaxID=3154350 RepID=UPI0033E4A432